MLIAIQTRTYAKDYKWYSDDSSFKSIAEQHWLNWHNEVYDGTWFGLTMQNGQTFFLAGKIPTQRQDSKTRPIVNYIVMQSQTPEESQQLALLTSDLLKKRQDISDVDSPFTQWADEICAPAAETGSCNYKPFPTLETMLPSGSGATISLYKYPLSNDAERTNVANALGALLENQKDFLVGCIQYPVERFLGKVCKDMSPNAQLAVFSATTTSKKEIVGTQVPFSKKKLTNPMNSPNPWNQEDGTTLNKALKALFNPLAIGLAIFAILVATLGHAWHQNSTMASQIQDLASQIQDMTNQNQDLASNVQDLTTQNGDLTSQVQDLTTQNKNLTNQIANKDTILKGYSDEIQKKVAEIQTWSTKYNNLLESFKNLTAKSQKDLQKIQRYETDLKAKDDEIEKLKKQINSLKELPSPVQDYPADSNPAISDSVLE